MSAAHVPWSRWTRDVHELRQRFNGNTIFNTRNGDPHPAVRTRGWGAWERQLDDVITKEQWFRWAEVERQSLVDEIGVLLNGVGRGEQCYENVMQLPSMDTSILELPEGCPGLGRLLLIVSVNGLIATASPKPRRHVYDEPDGVEMEWRNTFLACLDEPTWLRMALPGQQAVLRELEMMKEVCQEVPLETKRFGVLLLEVLVHDHRPFPTLFTALYSTHANTPPRPPLRQRDGQPSLKEVARELASRFRKHTRTTRSPAVLQKNAARKPKLAPKKKSPSPCPSQQSAYPALRQDPSRVTHRKYHSLINAYPQEGSSTAPVALDSELDAEAPVNYDATSPIWAYVQAVRLACEAQSYDLEQMWRWCMQLDAAVEHYEQWTTPDRQQVKIQLAALPRLVRSGEPLVHMFPFALPSSGPTAFPLRPLVSPRFSCHLGYALELTLTFINPSQWSPLALRGPYDNPLAKALRRADGDRLRHVSRILDRPWKHPDYYVCHEHPRDSTVQPCESLTSPSGTRSTCPADGIGTRSIASPVPEPRGRTPQVAQAVDAISSLQEPLSPRIRFFQAAVMDLNRAIDSKDEGAQQRAACSSRLRSWLSGWQAWRTQDMHSVTQQLEDDARVLRNGGPLPRFAATDPLTKALRRAHLYMERNGPLARALEALRGALHGRGDPNLAESYITYVKKQVADWFEWSEEDVVNVIREINRAVKEVEKGGTIPNKSPLAFALHRAKRNRMKGKQPQQLHSLAAGTLSFRQAAIYGLAPVTNRF